MVHDAAGVWFEDAVVYTADTADERIISRQRLLKNVCFLYVFVIIRYQSIRDFISHVKRVRKTRIRRFNDLNDIYGY